MLQDRTETIPISKIHLTNVIVIETLLASSRKSESPGIYHVIYIVFTGQARVRRSLRKQTSRYIYTEKLDWEIKEGRPHVETWEDLLKLRSLAQFLLMLLPVERLAGGLVWVRFPAKKL